ncbi:hypothetical protein A9Q79_07380 [Methylophaga sp. 42_25_T18]|nr:hypothetical protein A9Q79_07380 [Methylophaga sp. 42_25_T18]OUR88720.1 hypothetical protein A9Q92_02460 [Methylophaga sp. 42_8_T64]
MHKQHLFIKSLVSIGLLALSFQTQAEQWYHVELVVFEQLNTITDEQWPQSELQEPAPLSTDMATPLIQPAENETLVAAAQRLNRSSRYRVHYHQAWQQPVLEKRLAQAITVQSENEMIDGNIRLYKATYLHAELDLWLMQNAGLVNAWSDASPEGIDISAPRNPNLNESRRIRSKKLYFFDHPKLGALIQLTPIDTPAAALVGVEHLETFSLPSEGTATVTE